MKLDTRFSDAESIKTINLKRIIFFCVFILAFSFTEIGRKIYRPFIYSNHINDFGLADCIGNLGGIITQIFFGLVIFNSSKKKGLRLIAFFTIGYIIYEFFQPYMPHGVFDWLDILGTLIGGVIGLVIFLIINRIVKQK